MDTDGRIDRRVEPDRDARVRRIYEAYSTQDLPALLRGIAEDVDWPDGATRLHGREAVAAYWTEQWTRTRTRDVPAVIAWLTPTICVVRVDQVVRARDGHVLSTSVLAHVLHHAGGLVTRLDIVPLDAADHGKKEQQP